MKQIKYLYFLLACAFSLVCCGEKSLDSKSLTTDAASEYYVAAYPGTDFSIDFTVTGPLNTSIKSDQDWCKASTTRDGNTLNVKLTFDNNEGDAERTANISVYSTSTDNNIGIKIVQAYSSVNVIEFAPEGGSYSFPVSSTMRLDCDADWVSIGENNDGSVIVTAEANNTGIVRTAVFNFYVGDELVKTAEVLQFEPWETEKRIGDPDVTFDESRLGPEYPQMQEWMKAGRTGGIPYLEEQLGNISKTFEAGTSIQDINAYLESEGKGTGRIIYLKNGEYQLNEKLQLYHGDVIIGESKDGVKLIMTGDGHINMNPNWQGGNNIGVRNLTMIGAFMEEDPDPTDMSEVLPGRGGQKSIDMTNETHDCYVDNVVIRNSASHPIWMAGHNNTIRDVEIDGAYNKGAGAQGYFFIDGNHQLVTGCKVTRIRHITMQNPSSKYNVFYKNDVRQEFSFHVNDGGDNLVSRNRITLPEFMSTAYCSIMGPWSSQHEVGGKNFIYCNRCLEENNGGRTPWSDNEVYIGPYEVRPADLYTNFRVTAGYDKPSGRTFYPVVLK